VGIDRLYEPYEDNDRPEHRDGRRWEGTSAGASDIGDPSDRYTYFDEFKEQVDAEYRADAVDRGCERVRETEENIVTPAMKRIEAEDPDRHLVGLEFRLKGRDRLEEKVAVEMAAAPELTAEEAFANVKDGIRYTFQYSEERYTSSVYADCERLEAAGFEQVQRRNSWTKEEYKGLNSWWCVQETGQQFEVQFHTQASFEAKQQTHAAYERIRDPTTPDEEVEGLRRFQRDVSATIPIPPEAEEIPDIRRRT